MTSSTRNWPFNGDAVAASDVRLLLGGEYQPPPSDRAIHQELLSMADGAYSARAQRRKGQSPTEARHRASSVAGKRQDLQALYAYNDETVSKGMGSRTQL